MNNNNTIHDTFSCWPSADSVHLNVIFSQCHCPGWARINRHSLCGLCSIKEYFLALSRVFIPGLPCSFVSTIAFIWSVSLVFEIASCNFLRYNNLLELSCFIYAYLKTKSLIRLSVAHRLTWLHEWSHNKINCCFWILTISQVIFIMGIINYQVSKCIKVFQKDLGKAKCVVLVADECVKHNTASPTK